jgi:integrase
VDGRQKELPLGPDLSVAKKLAKEHAARLVRIKSGFEHADSSSWMEAGSKPIRLHVEAWFQRLQTRGSSQTHARLCRDRVLRVLSLARIERISGLEVHTVEEALSDLRRSGIRGRSGNETLSDRSVYHHGRAVKSFSRWLRKTKRTQDDKLCDMSLPRVVVERKRKALSPDELAPLIETTKTQPPRAGISGEDRSVLYSVATGTGFRLGELESLVPESFDLGSNPPTITCQAAYTKNGKEAVQPIRQELANLLGAWLADKAPGSPVFVLNRLQAARALRKDLEAAGVAESESYDFHSLRHSYITAIVRSGASVKVAQELARHSDPKLTLNVYSHLTVHDLAEGLDGLSHALPEPEIQMVRTGTDGDMTIGQSLTIPTPCVPSGLSGTDDTSPFFSPGETQTDPDGQMIRSDRPMHR